MSEKLYRVIWECDVYASSPREAAEKAQAQQQRNRPDYWSGVFRVISTPEGEGPSEGEETIDLDEKEETAD
jgi:hypothetical protein